MTFEVMRAKEYIAKHVKDWSMCRLEPKLDGVRVICIVESVRKVSFYSRNGRKLDMFSHLESRLVKAWLRLLKISNAYTSGAMFDGEMCGSTFNEIGGAIHRKDHTETSAVYHVFHAMPLSRFKAGHDSLPQWRRRQHLTRVITPSKRTGVRLVESLQVRHDSHVRSVYERLLRAGYEGAMVKDMGAVWVAKRTRDWMKLKELLTEDLPIIGWKPGKGKFEGTVGAVYVLRTAKGKSKRVSVSGMDDDVRDWLYRNRKKLETGKLIAEIAFQNVTVHGSLRHPRFIKLRRDKEK